MIYFIFYYWYFCIINEIIDFNNNSNPEDESDDENPGQSNPFLDSNSNQNKAINIEEEPSSSDFNISSNNKFFTPALNERKTVELNEELTRVENPMDRVKQLSNNNSGGYNETGEMSLKDSINVVRNSLESLGNKGVYAEVEEIDFPEYYQITIKIPKDN